MKEGKDTERMEGEVKERKCGRKEEGKKKKGRRVKTRISQNKMMTRLREHLRRTVNVAVKCIRKEGMSEG